jgi:SOS response regulatory protein OraA/RecX
MDTQGFIAGPLSVLCILGLVMGTASAAAITATDSTINPGTGTVHHHLSPEAIISSLEQKGVDVSRVKTALQNGDEAAVKAWLENYFQTHKPDVAQGSGHQRFDLTNANQQQKIITKLEERGVDVTEVQADLQNGDTAAAKAWLENYFQAHKPETAGKNGTERLQLIIDNLEKKGVDVSTVKTALQNGDITSVKTWLKAYFDAHKGEMPLSHQSRHVQPVSMTGTSQ